MPPCPPQNPYTAHGFPAEKDSRSEEEKAKHMDRKTPTERARLLKEVFEAVEVRRPNILDITAAVIVVIVDVVIVVIVA